MPNAKGADEDAPLPLAQHRVPHGGRVARPLDWMPGWDWLFVHVDQPSLRQLTPRCHPPVLSVDEEHRHRDQRGYVGPRAAPLRSAPPDAGDGGEDPSRVWGGPAPARQVGLGARARPARPRPEGAEAV